MTIHHITVYFDVVCAWVSVKIPLIKQVSAKVSSKSYIGHRSLFQAIDLFQKTYPGAKQDEYRIEFRPYYRDRSLPNTGVSLNQRLESSLGSEGLEDMKRRVIRIGRAHGINFTFSSLIGSTGPCHRLIHAVGLSKGSEVQRHLIEHIYSHWHEVGADITSHDFLAESAEAVGFPESDALEVLQNGNYAAEVDRLDEMGRTDGVSCVPNFDVNGARIEGAADATTFFELLVRTKKDDELKGVEQERSS